MSFQIENVALPDEEQASAKAYWGSIDFSFYKAKRPWSEFIAAEVLKFQPRAVLEFGCNAGKNIAVINDGAKNVFISGIDVNAQAVAFGRKKGLRLAHGDETVC
ncbi:hypothetical protein [Mesorhizobium sp. KR1-2]|uniref:hypothetical protein n=1 Tax=Mesorhizobium sp. KR1-2 TaxID=3156609 RepID=UPI0032B5BE28